MPGNYRGRDVLFEIGQRLFIFRRCYGGKNILEQIQRRRSEKQTIASKLMGQSSSEKEESILDCHPLWSSLNTVGTKNGREHHTN